MVVFLMVGKKVTGAWNILLSAANCRNFLEVPVLRTYVTDLKAQAELFYFCIPRDDQ